ncbi:HAD family phosphatase [Bacillus sp. BGMRC 2118]|nr:HAD family phosphatase [Bacillus sp. BGMRC 2118]
MNEYKIVFLDIDGTIFRPDHTIEPSTKNAISQLQAKGIEVILATGRPLHEIDELAKELSISSFIAYNGAYGIYKNEEIVKETMNEHDVDKYLKIADNQEHTLVFYTHEMNAFTTMEPPIVKKFISTFDLRKNTIFEPSLKNDVLGLTLITNEENAQVHYEEFKEIHYTTVNVTGLTTCLDVIRDRVNKGMAVEAFIKKLGISRESTIAFGDGMNDKEMLSTVGEGFAMGNAHPDLLQYAKHKTTDVEHSGIYNGLKSLGLVE